VASELEEVWTDFWPCRRAGTDSDTSVLIFYLYPTYNTRQSSTTRLQGVMRMGQCPVVVSLAHTTRK
jgi:hypothetical protein